MTVGSDSTDESETEDEAGGESGPEQLAENLLKHAKRQVEEYAKSTVEADLALTAALTREQRKHLHAYVDTFELQHNTVGNGTDKRMVVSRFKPFAAVTAAQAKEVIGSWKRTDTRRKPCTFSGIDFEMQNLRADAGGKGIAVSALRSDADFNAVMRVPELVLRYDWPALARETGVYTNEKHLRDLIKCCFEKSLTEAALKERGRQQLLARL